MESLGTGMLSGGLWALIIFVVVVIVLLWLLSIAWTIKDAKLRGANVVVWGVIAIIPFVGAIAYSLMRPPITALDKEEQAWDMQMKQREMVLMMDCHTCGYPLEREFIACPHCGTPVRNQCQTCGQPVNPDWAVCPYCRTPANGSGRSGHGHSSSARTQMMPSEAEYSHGGADDAQATRAMRTSRTQR